MFHCRLLTVSRSVWMRPGSLVVVQEARSVAPDPGGGSSEGEDEVGVIIWKVRAGTAMWFLSHLL